MSNKTAETNAPAAVSPQQPASELPSLDRIRPQAIMAAILFVGQSPTYDRTLLRHATEMRTAVDIATDLLRIIEQQERYFRENGLVRESGQAETVEPQR